MNDQKNTDESSPVDTTGGDSNESSKSGEGKGLKSALNPAQGVIDRAKETAAGKAAIAVTNAIEFAKKTAIAAKAAWGWVSSTAIALFNPVGLIVTGVVLALILTLISGMATTNLIGKNENALGCLAPNSKGGGISIQPSDDPEVNAESMGGWFMSSKFEFMGNKPMSKKQAAAIVGNFHAEGGGVRFAVAELKDGNQDGSMHKMDNETANTWTSGGARGLGLAQWTWNPGRAGNLINKAKDLGKQWYDAEPQLELIKQELDTGPYGASLEAAGWSDESKTAGELAIIFHDIYEVSNDTPEMKERRATAATDFEKKFTGYNGGQTGGSCLQSGGGSVTGCEFPDAGYDVCGAIEFALAEVGTSRPTGWSAPGECIMSVKRWMESGGGHKPMGGGSPRSQWISNGMVEVPIKDARPGDVIQWVNAGDSFGAGVHTLLITANNGDGTFNIVESNNPGGSGLVGKQDNITLEGPGNTYEYNNNFGYTAYAFRSVK